MTRRTTAIGALGALAVLTVLLVGFMVVFVDLEPILRDRAMRAPADACPRLQFGPRRCDAVVTRALEGAA